MKTPGGAANVKRQYLLLFLLLTAVYHSNLRPIPSGDTLGAALVPLSIVLDGSVALDRFAPYIREEIQYGRAILHRSGGHWHSTYPVAGPVATAPLYLPVLAVPRVRELHPRALIAVARIAEKVVASSIAALTAVVMFALFRRLTGSRAAYWLALVFALGTSNWSTNSQALWQHTYGSLAIAGCFYAMSRLGEPGPGGRPASSWVWAAGACAGLAIAMRPTNVILIPAAVLALAMSGGRRLDFLRLLVPVGAAGLALYAYNQAVFGSLAGGYAVRMETHLLDGLAGVLFSPARGLVIFTPLALFALAAFAPGARDSLRAHRALAAAAVLFVLLQVSLVARWHGWWGGYCWGPRLLTELLPPAMILVAIGFTALRSRPVKTAFACAAGYCVLVQAVGVYFYPKGNWDAVPFNANADNGRLWDWADNPIVRTAQGGFVWEPYAIAYAAVTGGPGAASEKIKELGLQTH